MGLPLRLIQLNIVEDCLHFKKLRQLLEEILLCGEISVDSPNGEGMTHFKGGLTYVERNSIKAKLKS